MPQILGAPLSDRQGAGIYESDAKRDVRFEVDYAISVSGRLPSCLRVVARTRK